MKILLVAPKPGEPRSGNSVTARRWAGILEELGHDVRLAPSYGAPGGAGGEAAEPPRAVPEADEGGGGGGVPSPADLLVALHARRSAGSVERFRRDHPGAPVVLALTGTDLYRDLDGSETARRAVLAADRLVVLQEKARERLPAELRRRTRVIHQSARPPDGRHPPAEDRFEVCVLCHMRPVKDPFLAAEAVRLLPSDARVRVLHAGAPLTEAMEARARAEDDENPRWSWLGELSRPEALALLARSRLMVLSSRLEGGANVVTEALACGTPVLSSRIDGSVGILGEAYPGYFPVGDAPGLASRLHRAEVDPGYLEALREACRRRAHLADPQRERAAWEELLEGLGGAQGEPGEALPGG